MKHVNHARFPGPGDLWAPPEPVEHDIFEVEDGQFVLDAVVRILEHDVEAAARIIVTFLEDGPHLMHAKERLAAALRTRFSRAQEDAEEAYRKHLQ